MVERINHKDEAIELLLSQYSDSDNVQLLLESWLTPVQDLEDSLIEFMDHNGITTAYGSMLDVIGGWFGVDRLGREDNEYRTELLGQSVLEKVDGTTERFLEAFRVITNSEYVTFEEYFPYTVYAVAGEGWNNTLIRELQKLRPAGIHLRLLIDVRLDSMTFAESPVETAPILLNGEEWTVIVDGQPQTLITGLTETGLLQDEGAEFAEVFDTEWTPMAELLLRPAKVVDNYLVDQDENFIVDQDGNKFIVRHLEY